MRRLLAVVFVAVLCACGGGKAVVDPMRWHADALAETDPKSLGAPAPGSAAETEAVARFTAFFGSLEEAGVKAKIREVYSPDTRFNDTLKSIRGVDALEHYLVETTRNVESCKVAIEEVVSTAEGVYVRWKMDILFKKFRKGQVQSSIGMTHLRFDKEGRVAYHQDYWDSGANLFEKVPVLGAGIRAVKRRL